MKKSFIASFLAMLGVALLCISLTGCENFLNGADIKAQLDSIIKDANAPKIQIYIKADENVGTISPNGLFECKQDSSFLILFEPVAGYKFIKWEVVNRVTDEPISGAVIFEDETKNETRVTVKENIANIKIQPVYVALPCIVSSTPDYYDSGVYANMPIEVSFNIPMINDDGSAFNFSYDNISIVSNGKPVEQYFSAPNLSMDGKSLIIYPKALEFQEYIVKQGKRAVDVQVSFKTDLISITLGGEKYYLFHNSKTVFSYKVNSALETVSPLCDDLIVSKTKDGIILPSEDSSETQFNDLNVVKDHAVGKYIYVHGAAFDSDSGVRSIVLEETPLTDKAGDSVMPVTKKFVYEKEDIVIFQEENKQIDFMLKHELNVDDGCFYLNVYVEDYCGNKSESTKYKLIKDTYTGIDDIFVYNYVYVKHGWGGAFLADINKTEFENEISNLKIYIESDLDSSVSSSGDYYFGRRTEIKKIIYKSYEYPLNDLIVKCKYISTEGPVEERMVIKQSNLIANNTTSKYWALENGLKNVNSVAGLKFTISISDDFGNYEEKEYQFPSTVETINKIDTSSSNSTKVYFNSSAPCNGNVCFTTDNTKWYPTLYSPDKIIQFSSNYNKDVALYTLDNGCLLFGPINTVAIDDSVDGVVNNETREEALNLLVPSITYSKGTNSGSLFVTMKFDSNVWDYWDEIQFNDKYVGSYNDIKDSDRHLLTKGITTYVYEDEDGVAYTYNNSKITMNATKISQVVKDDSGNITQIESISGSKDIILPSVPYDCYTFPPNVKLKDYYSMVDGKFVISPITVSLAYNTQEIKRVIYWEKYGTKHVDGYIKKEGTGLGSDKMYFYYPVENFLEYGDVTFIVEDEKGNTSEPVTIKENKMLYISRIDSTNKVSLSEQLDTNGSNKYYVHFSSFDNSGWSSDHYFQIQQWSGVMNSCTIPNPASTGYIPEKKFVRFYMTTSNDYQDYLHYSKYSYFYYDSTDSSSHIGYIIDDNRGIFIFSEIPVYVYTVSSKLPYDQCSKWDVSDWEASFHKISNEVVMDFQNEAKRYPLDLTSLEPGDNYVVIVHFADGHTDMSAVRHFE
ncbi:MAG: hypothetical protein J5726_11370 [Treponema sp.]|nr:hypothetical protein [Treponema sp.]